MNVWDNPQWANKPRLFYAAVGQTNERKPLYWCYRIIYPLNRES